MPNSLLLFRALNNAKNRSSFELTPGLFLLLRTTSGIRLLTMLDLTGLWAGEFCREDEAEDED